MKFSRLLGLLALAGALCAQSWDSSGNSMLNGTFYFRQVVYMIGYSDGTLGDAIAVYGEITFDGNGNYSINANGPNGGAVVLDYAQGAGGALPATTGKYSIGAAGYGYIVSPSGNGDQILGMVSANGVFIGSATDNTSGYNDMMIAAQVASPAPTMSSFTGSWTVAAFDPNYSQGLTPSYMTNAMFTLNPDGAGHLNAGAVAGYFGGSTQLYPQTLSGLTYTFSNGAAVASFPINGLLVYGQKYLYFSPDGNFMFGGGPNNFDMIVGVKTTSNPTFSGLYYQVGLDEVGGDLDTNFGSFKAYADMGPQTLLGHQRINDFGGTANTKSGGSLYDYTYSGSVSLSGNTYSDTVSRSVVGAGGSAIITSGVGQYLTMSVALQAPTPTGTGVFLDPTGVLNSASYAPATARIAPGELLTLFGSNLADSTPPAVQGGTPFPTTLGKVQVTIGGHLAPIYYVSPTQISVIVPYELTVGQIAGIQVTNNLGTSNMVTQYVSATAPGVFTQTATGLGYGAIEHLGVGNSVAGPYTLVSDANPAVEGETLAVYLTGLGTVQTAIADGALGNGSPTTSTIVVNVAGTAGTNGFSGLASGLAGLYQLNATAPTGLTLGSNPNFLDIAGPDSYMHYPLLPLQATPPTTSSDTNPEIAAPSKLRWRKPAGPTVRLPVTKIYSQAAAAGDQR